MKTKFILHGGYTSAMNELNERFFNEMVNNVPDGGSILLVYFASNKEEEIGEKFQRDCERIKSFAGNREIYTVRATKENFIEVAKNADVIYIRGGNTQKLKAALDAQPGFVEVIKGKTVAGSSAGAYVLSKYYFTNSLNKVLEGYGCAPVRVVCHYKSETHPSPEGVDPVSEIDKYDNNLGLVLLKDYEWEVIKADI